MGLLYLYLYLQMCCIISYYLYVPIVLKSGSLNLLEP